MKNLKEAKELLEKYKRITLGELEQRYKKYPGYKGKLIMQTFTDFGTVYCILCKSANGVCSNCIYSFINEKPALQCMDSIYKEMSNSISAIDNNLFPEVIFENSPKEVELKLVNDLW